MGKILPILLALIGVGAGVGAGLALRPDPTTVMEMHPCGEADYAEEKMAKPEKKDVAEEEPGAQEYVKLNNQFVVPVVADDLIDSLVVMSLSVEISQGQSEVIYTREPKLRDAFLQVLFDHANIGGFQGEFTNASNMDVLRVALTETARGIVGQAVLNVLITDIARQDI
ncbi:MAG: flagellar basal body-associated FliL family protein [Pseudomonadota bacterium]